MAASQASGASTYVGTVSTIAGSGLTGFGDSPNKALQAQFNSPLRLGVDKEGFVYVSDPQNHRIRRISQVDDGSVTTIGGGTSRGYQDGAGAQSLFFMPEGCAVDPNDGTVYVSDSGNNRIRKIVVDRTTGQSVVSTVAGVGQIGYVDGPGASAKLNYPAALCVSPRGDIYFIDQNNHRIRKVSASGIVSTIAGTGSVGFMDGNANTAAFGKPLGITVDSNDNIFISDTINHRIRKIANTGLVSTFAGDGTAGSRDGPVSQAQFNNPAGITCNANDELLITELYNHRIRKISADGTTVTSIAGLPQPGYLDGQSAVAKFNAPKGIATDASGTIYIADTNNNRIRKITMPQSTAQTEGATEKALSQALLTLLSAPQVADKTITVADSLFKLHQSILLARAPRLLEDGVERELNAAKVSAQAFFVTLEFIYGEKLPSKDVANDVFMHTLVCARIINLKPFFDYIRNVVICNLTPQNVIDVAAFSLDNNLTNELFEFCKLCIMKNFAFFSAPQVKPVVAQKMSRFGGSFNLDQILASNKMSINPAVLALEQQLITRIVPPPLMTLNSDLKRLAEDKSSCDFKIVMGSADIDGPLTILCHRAVLYCRWLYFATLISSGMREATEGVLQLPLVGPNSPEMEEIAFNAISKLVGYFYTGNTVVFLDPYDCLYTASCASYFALMSNPGMNLTEGYDHTPLIKQCIKSTSRAIQIDTAIQICNAAFLLRVDEVFDVSKQYIIQHFLELADNPNLHNLPSQVLSQIYAVLFRKVLQKLQL